MQSFRIAIESSAYAYPIERCRLVRMLANPKCPARLVRDLAINLIRMADRFPAMLARLFAATTHPVLRAVLLENLFEEEGLGAVPEGFTIAPERRHSHIARRFGKAAGVGDADIRGGNVPVYRWFEEALAKGNWRGAFAYLNIGLEANNARLMGPMRDALLARGFSRSDLEFFDLHSQADVVHGSRNIEAAIRIAATEEEKRDILDGVACGAREFWELNN